MLDKGKEYGTFIIALDQLFEKVEAFTNGAW